MSNVLFGQSYYLRFDAKLWAAMQPYPPLGTLYAASYLRGKGYDVGLFDAMLASSEADWERALEQNKPRYAILYEDNFNYLSKMCLLRMRQAAFTMMEMALAAGCTVIVAGSDASDHYYEYLSRGAKYVLIGEGEYSLGELMDHLTGREEGILAELPGLAFADPEGKEYAIITPRRPDIKDLDALPFPAWDLIDIPRYQEIWYHRHGHYSMNMVTSRGCPYHCSWCAKPIWGQRYHYRSPHNVVDELKWLKESFKPDHIWFADDILGLHPGWIQQFADLLELQNLRTPFKSLHRVDLLLMGDTIQALRRAGAQMVWVGAESGSQKILDAMDKCCRVEQIYLATSQLHSSGIKVGFFLQFGYPGETLADIKSTFEMIRQCEPDDIGISVAYPLPGTKFYQEIKQQLSEKQNWVDSNDISMLYQGPFSTAFYRRLHRVLHKEFRIRRAWRRLWHNNSLSGVLRQIATLLHNLATYPMDRIQFEWLAHFAKRNQAPL